MVPNRLVGLDDIAMVEYEQLVNCQLENDVTLTSCEDSLWDQLVKITFPDSKVHGANMGPIWGRQGPGGPMLTPWNLLSGLIKSHAIWDTSKYA